MVKSKYLTNPTDWDERIRVMEANLSDGFYNFLYFNIVVNMIDAQDNADYDRELILKKMLVAFSRGAFKSLEKLIKELKEI